jgi:hypothetical protein
MKNRMKSPKIEWHKKTKVIYLTAKALRMPMRAQGRDELVRDGLLAALALGRVLLVEAGLAVGIVGLQGMDLAFLCKLCHYLPSHGSPPPQMGGRIRRRQNAGNGTIRGKCPCEFRALTSTW